TPARAETNMLFLYRLQGATGFGNGFRSATSCNGTDIQWFRTVSRIGFQKGLGMPGKRGIASGRAGDDDCAEFPSNGFQADTDNLAFRTREHQRGEKDKVLNIDLKRQAV